MSPTKRSRSKSQAACDSAQAANGADEGASAKAHYEQLVLKLMSPCPFDSDPDAVAERDGVDYSRRISLEEAHNGTAFRKVRVYADGIYDLFHQGHARQLLQAKTIFPKSQVYLLVGCCNDTLTRERKGETVMNEDERYDAIRHCRYVDEVVKDAPWSLDDDFLAKHKIDFVAHDELPYTTGSGEDVYKHLKERGMFAATQRTEGVSTSDIVTRIVRNYDIFIRRNLSRGYSRKDLNVSFLRGQRIKLQTKVDELKAQTMHFIENKRDEVKHKWEEASKDVIESFVKIFGGHDWHSWDAFWQGGRTRIARALASPSNSPEHSDDDEDDDEDDVDDKATVGHSHSLINDGSFARKRKVETQATASAKKTKSS